MAYQLESKMDQISSELAQKFIAALKEETLPWSKGYDVNYHPPFNPATGTVYKGASNVILLLNNIEKGYTDPRYLTFNNAKDLGGHVRRGEKGVTCICIQPKTINLTDQEGKVILNEKEEPKQRELLIPCPYTVFNVAQIDGLEHVLKPLNLAAEKHQWDPHERAEELIKNSQAKITHSEFRDIVEAPCYSPYLDQIFMLERYQFKSTERYYGTLLHELCHWTGHPSRLNRFDEKAHNLGFGRPEYAKEELRAEIGSSLMCLTLGIKHDLDDNSKAYVKSWIKVLENDPREILKAAAQADKIAAYLRQYDIVKEKPNEPLLKPYQGKVHPQDIENVKQQAVKRIDLNVKQRIFDFSPVKKQEKSIPTQTSLER